MSSFQEIDVHKVREMLDHKNANIVDIRDPASYSSGHIATAFAVSDANVQEFTESTDKNKPLIVYCYHGISSQGAAAYFAQHGFNEVYSMAGGFEAWREVYADDDSDPE